MKNYFNKFIKSEVSKNTSVLVSGNIIAQLIPFLLQPVLRRFLEPEIFGAYSVYLSLLGIFIIIASFKYELSIVLPQKDKDSINIIFITIILNIIFNIILSIIITLYYKEILDFLNLKYSYKLYLYFVPLGVFLYNFHQAINYWLIRKKAFKSIAINKVVRRGFEGGTQISLVLSKFSLGLIIGDIIGHLTNLLFSIYLAVKNGFSFKLINYKKIKYVLKKYSEFPKYNLVPGFMSACSYLLPAIFINKFYGSDNAGYFDLAKMLLSIPLALIATSVSNVLLQKTTENIKTKKSIINDILPVLSIILTIVFIELFTILLFGESLYTLIFGNQWIISGKISKILVWSFVLNFIVSSFSSLFISMRKIKILSIWQALYFLAILSLYFFRDTNFDSFISIYVLFEVICSISIIIIISLLIYKYEKSLYI